MTAELSPSAQRGAALFHDKRCESCHMINGYGGLRGPNLTRVADRMTDAQMEWRILNGGHNMPSFAGILKPEEVDDLLSFLHTRGIPPGSRPPISKDRRLLHPHRLAESNAVWADSVNSVFDCLHGDISEVLRGKPDKNTLREIRSSEKLGKG